MQEVENLSEEVTELTPEKKPSAIICGIPAGCRNRIAWSGSPVDRVGCKSTGATVGLVREAYWFDNRIRWNRLAGSRCVAGIQSAWSQRCGDWQRDRIQSVQHSDDSRLTGLVIPLPVQASIVSSDCWWMLGVTGVLLPILLNGRRINRWEGAVLLAAYAAYLGVLLSQ